jgi:hypothetical protein
MSAKNQIVEIDHVLPATVYVDSILVKPEAQPALLGRCRYRDNDQRAFETTQHPGERVLA